MREPSVEQGRVGGMLFAVVSIEKVIGFSATLISGSDVSLEDYSRLVRISLVWDLLLVGCLGRDSGSIELVSRQGGRAFGSEGIFLGSGSRI